MRASALATRWTRVVARIAVIVLTWSARIVEGGMLRAPGANIRTVQQIDAKILTMALTRDGRVLFAVDDDIGLTVYDVSDPSKPVLTTTVPTAGKPVDCALSEDDGTLFVADGVAGLTVVNVENPRFPILVSTIALEGKAELVRFARDGLNTFAFVGTSGYYGVIKVNVTDHVNPKVLASMETKIEGGDAYEIDVLQVSGDGKLVAAHGISTRTGKTEHLLDPNGSNDANNIWGYDGVSLFLFTQTDATSYALRSQRNNL